jgi:Predicted GTPase, probable translation factor
MEPLRRHKEELGEETVEYAKKTLFFLSIKPTMYVANVGEEDLPQGNEWSERVNAYAEEESAPVVVMCAKLEADLIGLEGQEKLELLKAYGLEEPGLNKLIREGYRLLGLITFFTAGERGKQGLDHQKGHKGTTSGGQDPLGYGKGLHSGRGHQLRRIQKPSIPQQGKGAWSGKVGGQGLRGSRRRHNVL